MPFAALTAQDLLLSDFFCRSFAPASDYSLPSLTLFLSLYLSRHHSRSLSSTSRFAIILKSWYFHFCAFAARPGFKPRRRSGLHPPHVPHEFLRVIPRRRARDLSLLAREKEDNYFCKLSSPPSIPSHALSLSLYRRVHMYTRGEYIYIDVGFADLEFVLVCLFFLMKVRSCSFANI
jgi:hypothetical protein